MRRRYFLWALFALAATLLTIRGYRQHVPSGASIQPYLLASRDGPAITSPDGEITLRVVFNDAGAAHSGHHWTWFVAYSPWWGYRVVAQGYLSDRVAVGVNGVQEPLPLTWLDDRTLEVEFRTSRRATTTARHRVRF